MFNWLIGRKMRMHLEELKHKHGLEIDAANAKLELAKREWSSEKQLLENRLKQEHELKLKEAVTLTKLDSEQRIKQVQLDADRVLVSKMKELNESHYKELSASMTKLHEEGNVTTKFTQDIALKMFENMPKNSSETKVLTGTIDVKK